MPLTLIKGRFRPIGASPDGDSVRFYPDDPQAWASVRLPARTNAAGGAQLRLDAIDALEAHYTPRGSPTVWRQPTGLASSAADRLLELLGFTAVTRDEAGTVTDADPESTAGHVLTRFVDRYGRPVAFAFAGGRRGRDLSQVRLDVAGMRRSVNYRLLAEGLVYPTFYSRLFVDLRDALAEAAVTARAAESGIWAADVTTAGFSVRSRAALTDELVILPKLFRRLADYLALSDGGRVDLGGFAAFLEARDDRLFTIPDGWSTALDTLVEVRRSSVRLTVLPERIVFLEL